MEIYPVCVYIDTGLLRPSGHSRTRRDVLQTRPGVDTTAKQLGSEASTKKQNIHLDHYFRIDNHQSMYESKAIDRSPSLPRSPRQLPAIYLKSCTLDCGTAVQQAWQIRDWSGWLFNRSCHISIASGFASAAATNDALQLCGLGAM